MSRAFDSIDRHKLFNRLHELGVRKEVVKLLSAWHSATDYVVQTGDVVTSIPVERGLRQGCKAAPWLWNSTMALLLTDLAATIDPTWLRDNTNLYADDVQAGDVFHSESELFHILNNFAVILTMLKKYGLQINEDKSQILLLLTGPDKQHIKQKILHHSQVGTRLMFSADGHSYAIPVTDSAKYLGAVVSYGNLEDHTVRHRTQLATVAFKRLLIWFTGRRGLATHDKIRLWNTCVFPILTYGIYSTGITTVGAKLLNNTITVMLRKILMDHSYITRHSNRITFHLHDIDPPLVMLWRSVERLQKSVTQRCLTLRPQDLVHSCVGSTLISSK